MNTDTDTTTTGHPMTGEAIAMILRRHTAEVPEQLRRPNGLTPHLPGFMPDVLAYDPRTGHRLGSAGTPTIAAHRDRLVLLDTRRVPTLAELESIRIDPDGKVTY